jgi:cytochrome oxidase Cu insertion factor (SCO1/SenC/PrrC family)
MNSGVNANDPTVIAAFKAALIHQGIIALLIFGLLGLAWITVRAWLPAAQAGEQAAPGPSPAAAPAGGQAGPAGPPRGPSAEPAWRQVLRIGFGLLWVFDGILQAQPKMAIGLPSQVIQPAAASSPHWVQQVVNWAGTTWSYHPMQAGAAAVWIQIGIGIWLLAAPQGGWSRLAGLAGVGWGLVVWVFGESFGGVFAPGLTWLFGAPGAVLVYVVAGALIALPKRVWHDPRFGQAILSGLGLFLVAMAVLQAWPGRGFWQGLSHGHRGTLAGMTHDMTQTPQPGFLSGWVSSFTSFDEAHGFAVNLFAVATLALIGAAFLTGRGRLARPALIAFTVLCLADWVLIEDIGIFGGLGTDPNSMIPLIMLAVSGYLALTPGTAPAEAASPAVTAAEPVPAATPASPAVPALAPASAWRDRFRPGALRRGLAAASFPTVVSIGALGLIILGAAPMAAAQASRNADPILAESIAGSSAPLNFPAKSFALTDQHGRPVSLASLRGKVVLLTFLDPVCTSDCPLIAQEFRAAGQLLGAASKQVELVAVVANPVYHQVTDTQAFDRAEHLDQVPNWLYLTGSVPQLQQVWKDYDITAEILPAGSMIAHQDVAYVIDRAGHVREELNTDPGPGTTATKSSFAVLLADAARQALRSS